MHPRLTAIYERQRNQMAMQIHLVFLGNLAAEATETNSRERESLHKAHALALSNTTLALQSELETFRLQLQALHEYVVRSRTLFVEDLDQAVEDAQAKVQETQTNAAHTLDMLVDSAAAPEELLTRVASVETALLQAEAVLAHTLDRRELQIQEFDKKLSAELDNDCRPIEAELDRRSAMIEAVYDSTSRVIRQIGSSATSRHVCSLLTRITASAASVGKMQECKALVKKLLYMPDCDAADIQSQLVRMTGVDLLDVGALLQIAASLKKTKSCGQHGVLWSILDRFFAS